MIKGKTMVIRPADAVEVDDNQDLVAKYIEPDTNCLCCNIPKVSLKINMAYLEGNTYQDIIDKYGDEITQITGNKLDKRLLSLHFTKHFNFKGAAIAEYNRKHNMNQLVATEQKQMSNVFDALTQGRINDLELLDLAMREQIKRMQELEDLKKERIEKGQTYNLQDLIMKQESIMNNMQTQILSKLKIWQKSQFQTKQMEVMDRQLQFLDQKTANFLGVNIQDMEPTMAKEAEKLYLSAVIANMIKPIKETVNKIFAPDPSKTAQFFKELKNRFKGINFSIDEDYKKKIDILKQI